MWDERVGAWQQQACWGCQLWLIAQLGGITGCTARLGVVPCISEVHCLMECCTVVGRQGAGVWADGGWQPALQAMMMQAGVSHEVLAWLPASCS